MNNKKINAIMLRIIASQYIASKNTDAVFNADAEVKYNGINAAFYIYARMVRN